MFRSKLLNFENPEEKLPIQIKHDQHLKVGEQPQNQMKKDMTFEADNDKVE